MAAIEKIRRHSVLLIAIIGIALLAFVLQDLFQSQGRNTGPTLAVVDGERISVRDYDLLREKNLESRRASSNNNSLSSAETYSIYNSTLEEMIKDIIMTKEYDASGIGITPEELMDQMTGEHPHDWVVQSFSDANGFDPQRVNEYLQNLGNLAQQAPDYYNRWIEFERALKQNRLETKYENLLKASYFLPTALAQKYYEIKNLKASADVIALRYASIPDSTVTVTDADNRAFYNENKYRYETNERRDIEYVVFEVTPSLADRQRVLKLVQDLKPEFEATENVAAFVNDSYNSDKPYDSTWLGRKDVPSIIEAAIFDNGNGVGYVYGPYENDQAFNLVRIVDMQQRPDSLRASHILIGYQGAYGSMDTITEEQAQAKANELMNQIKSDRNSDERFAELAAQYNTDATKDKGGDLDWFRDGQMVSEFNDFVMNNPVGTIGVVKTMFGYHVVKVTDKTQPQPKVRLAYVTQKIDWSQQTYQDVYAQANKFFTENRNYDDFNRAIEELGLTKRTMPGIDKSTYQIPGLTNAREIVRWAFDPNTKKGDISDKIFESDDDQQLIVAALTGVIHEGYAPLEVVVDQARYQILNKKKGEMAVERMNACGNDINRMISELGAESTTVSDITLESRVFGNFGVESEIVGRLLGMQEGQEVGPVAGNSSAFILRNVRFTTPAEPADLTNIIREKVSQFTNKVGGGAVYNALRNKAKIKDNRTELF